MKNAWVVLLLLIWLPLDFLMGQDVIELRNPSFEESPRNMGQVPSGWIDLGSDFSTPVDVQPGFFNVNLKAQDGENFVGMVVRENNTWEGIGQVLDGVMQRDSSYTFSVWLAKSTTYKSASPLSNGEELVFNSPTILKIWGYNTETKEEELLAESQPVGRETWTKYQFLLTPKQSDYNEIDLMAYYAPGYINKNGNLLIDNCSAIIRIKQ